MTLPNLTLETNKNLKSVKTVTVRQSEKGGVLTAYLVDANHSPLDLTGKSVTFMDAKANEKWVSDDNVKIIDAPNGEIEYTLHDQAYAGSGTAWFEINNSDGTMIDSTQDFYITVDTGMNVSVYNTNYVSKLDEMRDQLQQIVDSADGSLKAELQKMADGLTQKLADMQTAYNASNKQWQATFQQSEQSRADDYTAEKNKRLADDTANANAFSAAQNKRDSDFASQQDTISKAASDQRDAIDKQWTDKQTQLVSDWMTKRATLDTELSKYESTVNSLQAAVDQLNKTDLPNAQQKMDALNSEIQKAEQTFSQVDFSKFATTDELATKADKTDVATELGNYYDKTTTDSKLAGKANTADVYTKTELDPKLAEAGKVKTVSLNGGNKVAPDSGGNIDLSVPQPDLTGYAKTADVNGQFTTVNNQIKELQSQQSTFTPITQADYDKLTDAQKANGMYAIGDSN